MLRGFSSHPLNAMSSDSVFVPLEPWVYHSPSERRRGKIIDVGLLAEALIYYDRVYFALTSDAQFAALVLWFRSQGLIEDFIALLNDGTIIPYYYAFATLAGTKDNIWSVMNLQDEGQAAGPTFESRVLRSGALEASTRKHSLRQRIVDAALSHHLEVKAADFGNGLANAHADYQDPQRASLLLQVLMDELYHDLGFIRPEQIKVSVTERKGLHQINWGIDLKLFENRLGPMLAVTPGTPLAAAGFGTKTVWSAGMLRADLYVGAPIGDYLQYKLSEGGRAAKTKLIIDDLVAEVAFPSVRQLVNQGRIGFREVLELRNGARRFREWLRTESEFDRNAVIAYHEEVAREVGWKQTGRRVLAASSVIGGAAAGAALGGPLGAVGGAVAGEAVKFVLDLAAKFDQGWRPRVFGEWARARIERALAKER